MSKPYFDPKYLDKMDPICRKLAKVIFIQHGYEIIDGDEFGVDLLMFMDGNLCGYLEVEYADSGRFVGPDYISKTQGGVSIPGRKAKWFHNGYTWWINFSADLSYYIIIPGLTILRDGKFKYYEPNNNPGTEEGFYIVPLSHPSTKRWIITPDLIRQAGLI